MSSYEYDQIRKIKIMRADLTIRFLTLMFALCNQSIVLIKTDIMQGYSLIYSSEGFQKIVILSPGYECSSCIKTKETILSELEHLSPLKQITVYWIDTSAITKQIQIKIYDDDNNIISKLNGPNDSTLTQLEVKQLINKYITQEANGKYNITQSNGYSVQVLENSDIFLRKYQEKMNQNKRLLKIQGEMTSKRAKPIQQNHQLTNIPLKNPSYDPIIIEPTSQPNQLNQKQFYTTNTTNSGQVYYLIIIGLLFIFFAVGTILYRGYCQQEKFTILANEDDDGNSE